jgi:hypothetical protein
MQIAVDSGLNGACGDFAIGNAFCGCGAERMRNAHGELLLSTMFMSRHYAT